MLRKLTTISIALLAAGIFYRPLYELALLSIEVSLLSHALLVPVVSLYLFWVNRKTIFADLEYAPVMGIGLMMTSLVIVLYQKLQLGFLNQNDALSVSISSMIIWILGAFILVCGRRAFVKALFPLLFLGFMIPIPSWALERVVHFLQIGSTYSAQTILRLFNVPAYFEGVVIMLPGATVEVAEECSGIRSAVALLILTSVAGYLFLNSNWRRLCLVLCAVPITMIKNGMRVVTLALLGSYVDMSYLTDSVLHNWGGKPFLLVAMSMMFPILWVLRRSERNAGIKVTGDTLPVQVKANMKRSNDARAV
ncbi:MAG: exosortase/archaeosortase family protein [Desulfobacteraceae bacterium]